MLKIGFDEIDSDLAFHWEKIIQEMSDAAGLNKLSKVAAFFDFQEMNLTTKNKHDFRRLMKHA